MLFLLQLFKYLTSGALAVQLVTGYTRGYQFLYKELSTSGYSEL